MHAPEPEPEPVHASEPAETLRLRAVTWKELQKEWREQEEVTTTGVAETVKEASPEPEPVSELADLEADLDQLLAGGQGHEEKDDADNEPEEPASELEDLGADLDQLVVDGQQQEEEEQPIATSRSEPTPLVELSAADKRKLEREEAATKREVEKKARYAACAAGRAGKKA
jgi:hypothetical protein